MKIAAEFVFVICGSGWVLLFLGINESLFIKLLATVRDSICSEHSSRTLVKRALGFIKPEENNFRTVLFILTRYGRIPLILIFQSTYTFLVVLPDAGKECGHTMYRHSAVEYIIDLKKNFLHLLL